MKKSSLFLLELVFMIFIFSICAAVCVSILGKSWNLSRDSERLTHAVYLAETAAARFQAHGEPLPEGGDGYTITLEDTGSSRGLTETLITVHFEEEAIYSLNVTREEGQP